METSDAMETSLLFGKSVVVAAKSTIEKIQRYEHKVYKFLIGVAGYVTIAALRGLSVLYRYFFLF